MKLCKNGPFDKEKYSNISAPRLYSRCISVDVVWRETSGVHTDSCPARDVFPCGGGEGKGRWEDADSVLEGKMNCDRNK